MGFYDDLNNDIYYIVEVELGEEKLYMFTKRVALHFSDMGKKFLYKRSAQRYFKDSVFDEMNCKHRIVRYSRFREQIID